ncbi:MAG: DNA mismatch repair protein MutS [Candidatus Aminicenantes bacterium]|nr:DNA mismatch repair protein MutS [Candidatus Aminicenantes bacterium]
MSEKNSVTPMMEQYFRIKKQHRDTLLFFRLGDFYEMFYEDAKIGSAVLEIALTSRQKVPMCGVPYHAVNPYLAKLLRRGYKVAVCEQVEDPKTAKGVVKREVIKVLTPGTAVEVELEAGKENVYIVSVSNSEDGWGLALIDLTSGEMKVMQREGQDYKALSDELFKTSPKELVFPEGDEEWLRRALQRSDLDALLKSPVEAWAFEFSQARDYLMDHFRVKSLAGFGIDNKNLAVSAAGALLYYLKKVRKDSLALIRKISFIHPSDQMALDASTIRNLELVKNLRDGRVENSLLGVIDYTVTPMGGRLLRSRLLQPLLDCPEIGRRLDAVEESLKDTITRQELRESLKGILDLERLAGKISLAAAHPRDLVALKKSLLPLPKIFSLLEPFQSSIFSDIRSRWDNARDIVELLDRAILDEPAFLLTEGGIIKDGFYPELDDLREISRSGKSFIALLEKKERERTGISSLKVRYNKIFGYYIEVTKRNLPQVPADYIRKQTLVSSERFLTPELEEYEEKVLRAEERIGELEVKLFNDVREKIAAETARLLRIASDIAALDVHSSLGELAARRNYFRPDVNAGEIMKIKNGRHPVIEIANAEPFIPNDTYLDRDEDQILIITGPNMGGKSTYLRQVALICILAQMGSFVPAQECMIGAVDRIFTRIGAMDFLSVGQSTFMVEMLETANILNNATPRSLILLDEVGRGTSTFDGLSIAWAVAEYLHENVEIRAKTLFATHYHELTELALTLKRIKNYHVAVKEWKEEVVFLRKIIAGPSDQSYGIHVAKLAGIPRDVVVRAREILFNLEKQELDETGLPRIARTSKKRDKSQLLLFQKDREQEILREMKDELASCDVASLTPLAALNLLSRLVEKLRQ